MLQPDAERIQASKDEEEAASGVSQTEMLSEDDRTQARSNSDITPNSIPASAPRVVATAEKGSRFVGPNPDSDRASQDEETKKTRGESDWVPKPPKVLMENPNATPLELRSQIQLYATNE